MNSIGIYSYKGGVGKTTLSLLITLFNKGKNLAVIDYDEQKGLTNALSNYNITTTNEVSNEELVIVDHPPSFEVGEVDDKYDLLVIPFLLSPIDYASLTRTISHISINQKVLLVANKCPKVLSSTQQEILNLVKEKFKQFSIATLRDFVAFRDIALSNNLNKVAFMEVEKLNKEIFKKLKEKN